VTKGFDSHAAIQQATVLALDRAHPTTRGLPERWVRTDEWFNFQANPRGNVHVLATVDEGTYSGGTMGDDHPIAWCQDFDGGRSFYTGLGHTVAAYSEPWFLDQWLDLSLLLARRGHAGERGFPVYPLEQHTRRRF
jgi:cytochrome c